MNESRAFVELTSYIELSVDSGTLLFKMNEIHNLYMYPLEELDIHKQVNKTRLKGQLLDRFPETQEQVDGRNTVLICLTIGQITVYNTKKRSSNTAAKTRHTLVREPPVPIGINVYARTRSKKLIEQLYSMGISISYDRIMEIEDWIATSTCERIAEDGVVCPASLRKGLFTVGALDNLDSNPSSFPVAHQDRTWREQTTCYDTTFWK